MGSPTRAKLNPSFQYFSELGKRLKYSLRPKHKDSSFESKDNLKDYVRIWVHCWKLGEFTENKAGHILNLMDEISKVFSLKMNREKSIFHFELNWTEFGTH